MPGAGVIDESAHGITSPPRHRTRLRRVNGLGPHLGVVLSGLTPLKVDRETGLFSRRPNVAAREHPHRRRPMR